MLPANTHIIQNAAKGKESEQRVMDGIIHSGVLTTFQQNGLDGIIKSALPAKAQAEYKKDRSAMGKKPMVSSVKAPATKFSPGFVKYPGSSY
jgi:hypothetical protein